MALLIGDSFAFMRNKVEPCQSANAELTYSICRFDIATFTGSGLNAVAQRIRV
jgi:hypothetical protein